MDLRRREVRLAPGRHARLRSDRDPVGGAPSSDIRGTPWRTSFATTPISRRCSRGCRGATSCRFSREEFALTGEGGPATLEEAREIHDAVLDLVGEIAGDVVSPTAADVDRDGTKLVDGRVVLAPATERHLAALREAGLFGFVIDRRFGGQNLPTTLYTASVEILSRACASLMNLYALQACGETIQNFGSEELARRFVPGVASGELSTCMSLSEADAGSALGSVATRAVPVDEAKGLFRLTGTKIFCTNGGADLILVLARTEEGSTDARGLSLFAVPRSDRVVVTKIEEKLGLHGSPTCALALDDAEGWLVGERRRGLTRYVLALIHGARLEVAAQAIGIAQGALHATVRYVKERRQFGRAIEDFAPVRQQVLEMEIARAGREAPDLPYGRGRRSPARASPACWPHTRPIRARTAGAPSRSGSRASRTS